MKIIITFLLIMSASGTLSFIIYLIESILMRPYFSASFRYNCLKASLLFFLLPLPLVYYIVTRHFFVPITPYEELMKNGMINFDGKLVQTTNGFLINSFFTYQKVIISFYFFAVCSVFLYYIFRFVYFRVKVVKMLQPENNYYILFSNLKDQMKLRRTILLYQSREVSTPCTYGVFCPVILLTNTIRDEDAKMILQHELQHIKSNDFFIRMVALFAVILHCFNPFIYLLFKELKEVQELSCDEKIMKQYTPEEKRKYGYLLIRETTEKEPECNEKYLLPFSANNHMFIKKRVINLTRIRKTHPILAILFSLLLCYVSSIPVYAGIPQTIDIRGTANMPEEEYKNCSWISFTPGENSISSDEINFQYSNTYFLSDDGEIIFPTEPKPELRSNCSHNYIKGVLKRHFLNGKGGCVVKIYNAKICSKCGNEIILSLVGTNTYVKCPH